MRKKFGYIIKKNFNYFCQIDVIIKEMGLDAARGTLAKNLSGGEKKRLATALELISNPPIMFFDEPTR